VDSLPVSVFPVHAAGNMGMSLVFFRLQPEKIGIPALSLHQIFMGTFFDNPAIF
jgi:hypothetical protein